MKPEHDLHAVGNASHPDSDARLDQVHHEQLSALIDGELRADQARFVIRRLEHDQALAGRHERWQLVGEVLRGELGAVAPVDFAARVAAALPQAAAAAPVPRRPPAWRWAWPAGGALAAGLALLAVLWMPRQATQPSPLPVLAQVQPALPPPTAPIAPIAAVPAQALPAPAPALASEAAPAPVRVAAATPVVRKRAAARTSALPAAPAPASSTPAAGIATAQVPASPFALPAAAPSARPWPRSQLAAPDSFNARLPGGQGSPFAVPEQAAGQARTWPSAPSGSSPRY